MWLRSLYFIRHASDERNLKCLPNVSIVEARALKRPAFRSDQASWTSSLLSLSAIDFNRAKSLKDDTSNGRASSPPLVSRNTEFRMPMLSSQWDP